MTTEELCSNLMNMRAGAMSEVCDRMRELARDLAESRKATASVQARAEIECARLNGQLDRSSVTVLRLTMEKAEQMSAARRSMGEVVQLARALRSLVDVMEKLLTFDPPGTKPEDVIPQLREAKEVLALVEVPFA